MPNLTELLSGNSLNKKAIDAGFTIPNQSPFQTVRGDTVAYQKSILSSQRESELNNAVSIADNNKAIYDNLQNKAAKDSGLLVRGNELSIRAGRAGNDSFQQGRVAIDRKRLLQDAGQNVSSLAASSFGSDDDQPRAKIRVRRARVGE